MHPTGLSAPAFGSSICSFPSCRPSSGFWGKKNKAVGWMDQTSSRINFKRLSHKSNKHLLYRSEGNLVIKDNTTKMQYILIYLKIKRIRKYLDILLSSNYKSASINREQYSSKPNNTMQKDIFNFLSMLILLDNMLLSNEVIFVLTLYKILE